MSDDLDDLLRRTMKTLDDQVPSGYFEALPDQTLQRLEASMQMSGTSESKSAQPSATPPAEREENSGLHDIRSLAHSTKQRLSKKITAAPVPDDLGATSGAWKHVALPEPAKMVALPALEELPPAKEVLAKEKAAAKAVEAAPEAAGSIAKPAFSAWADRAPKKSKAPLYAGIGAVLVAAAAGVFFYVQNQSSTKAAAPAVAMSEQKQAGAPAPTVTAEPIAQPAPPPPAEAAPADKADTTTAADTGGAVAAAPVAEKAEPKPAKHATKGGAKLEAPKAKAEEQKPADKTPKADKKAAPTGNGDQEPDFDSLLKEAGVDKNKQQGKPELAKKDLTGDDFMNGMSAVKGKAASCYKGTQGTVNAKVYIAPSGQITKVAISGQFAGTPEGSCVQAALKGATFPPWDGGPRSFSYPILLSE